MKSKVVALSAVSAAFIAIALTVGAYFEFSDLFALIVSSVFVILPLYLKSYKGSLLAYVVGGAIAFLCSGFNIISLVFPAYFAFFGLYPIIRIRLSEKKFNKYAGFVFGLIWCALTAFGSYFYYTEFIGDILLGLPEWVADYALYLVGIASIIFYFIYDRFVIVVKVTADRYLAKIIK